MRWLRFVLGKGSASLSKKRTMKPDAHVDELALAFAESYLVGWSLLCFGLASC